MPRIRILLCGHPNPLGCPNHGDTVREIWAAFRDAFEHDQEYVFCFADTDQEPIPYVLTSRGYNALRDAGVPPPPLHW